MNKRLLGLLMVLLMVVIAYYTVNLIPFLMNIFNFIFVIFLPFFISFIIAFLLAPIVDRLERYGRSRVLALIIVYIILFMMITFIFANVIPMIINQSELLIENVPSLIQRLDGMLTNIKELLKFLPDGVEPNIGDYTEVVKSVFEVVYQWVLNSFDNLFSSFTVIILIPVISAYLLLDYNKIRENLKLFLIKKNLLKTKKYFHDINNALGMYVRGLFLVMFSLSVLSSFLFFIVGLDYYLFFGFIIGLTNAIPIFGAFIGGALAVVYSLTISFNKAIIILIIILILQFIEGALLTPYIQSRSVKTHPLMIIFSVLFFGKLFGFFGVLLAVPLLTLIKLSVEFYLKMRSEEHK
ncbi:AI-2E family transporter [Mycoplasmatota bacterium WC44]